MENLENIYEFLSPAKYLILPSLSSPRVFLAISNKKIKTNSYKLYNPYSFKARILKKTTFYFSPFFYRLMLSFNKKGEFVEYLENKFKKKLITSVYIATDKKKFIIQLQDYQANLIAYVKVSNDKLGKERLKNEIKAYKKLSKLSLPFRLVKMQEHGYFNKFLYLIYSPIEIKTNIISDEKVKLILKSLRKNKKKYIYEHPKFLKIKKFFESFPSLKQDLKEKVLIKIFNLERRDISFFESYEHGDFAPWNLVYIKDKIYVIDWEFFDENGIEFLDYMKYKYQIYKLLKRYDEYKTLNMLKNNVTMNNFNEIFTLFLLNEIKNKIIDNSDYQFEENILNLLKF